MSAVDHPVLVPTPSGVIGAIVTEPVGDRRAAAIVITGKGASRAGVNRMWARLAHELAALGVVVFRADPAGTAESVHTVDGADVDELTVETARWFTSRAGPLDLYVIAYCYGLASTVELARTMSLSGAAVISPPGMTSPELWSSYSRAHVLASKVRTSPMRAWKRVRYGRAARPEFGSSGELLRTPELLVELAERAPLWTMTGEGDASVALLRNLRHELTARGAAIEIVEDTTIHRSPTLRSQDETVERTTRWMARAVAEGANA